MMKASSTRKLMFALIAAGSASVSCSMEGASTKSGDAGSPSQGPPSASSSGGSAGAGGATGSGDGTASGTGRGGSPGGASSGGTGLPGGDDGGGRPGAGVDDAGRTSNSGSGGAGSGDASATPGRGGGALDDGGGTSGGGGVSKPDGGASTDAGSSAAGDPYSGPFHILVLSLTKGFHHDSIPACHKMLRQLGRCVDAASCGTNDVIPNVKPNSAWDVRVAGASATACPPHGDDDATGPGCDGNPTDDAGIASLLGEFSAQNLQNYQLLFFCSPSGDDFSSSGAPGQAGMQAVQAFIENGGGYGGLHSATDFEQSNNWSWYTNTLTGAQFEDHNVDGTPGTVVTAAGQQTHLIMLGLPASLSTVDEWYCMRKDISTIPGMTILDQVTGVPAPSSACTTPADPRPATWIKEFPGKDPAGLLKGRMFYTIRGHNITRYSEAPFRRLVHQGILWAAHRFANEP
ncbi:MAG: ThuA domain-containing protein [Myxococcales bacterium]|nr:ThuA domain-containing protein [Myxococcales bacterium]